MQFAAIVPDLVRLRTPATLLLPEASRVLQARFDAAAAGTVSLLLYEPGAAPPTVGSVGCVQVEHDGTPHVFLARVLVVVRDDDWTFVTLQQPSALANVDARRAFRIPLTPGELPVMLCSPEGWVAGEIHDLSRFGVAVRIAASAEGPEVGDAVRLDIPNGEDRRVLAGRVVRRADALIGIAFTQDVPETIDDLVAEAEVRWLRRQRRAVPA